MKLYHYTAVTLGETILSSDLSQGHLKHPDNTIQHQVVWLTTDEAPEHHGLLKGNETLTPAQIAYQERVQGGPARNLRTLNKTQLRIGVELDPDAEPGLMSFADWCSRQADPTYAKRIGLSARVDLRRYTEVQRKKMMKTETTKENTWWLSFTPVKPERFVNVDFNDKGTFVPYDFESHGRAALRRDGIAVVPRPLLDELAQLVPSTHRFETTKALMICGEPSMRPMVVVRGGGQMDAYDISNGQHVVASPGRAPYDVQDWLLRHRAELMTCWEQAIELFYEAYPERQPKRTPRDYGDDTALMTP